MRPGGELPAEHGVELEVVEHGAEPEAVEHGVELEAAEYAVDETATAATVTALGELLVLLPDAVMPVLLRRAVVTLVLLRRAAAMAAHPLPVAAMLPSQAADVGSAGQTGGAQVAGTGAQDAEHRGTAEKVLACDGEVVDAGVLAERSDAVIANYQASVASPAPMEHHPPAASPALWAHFHAAGFRIHPRSAEIPHSDQRFEAQ